jgi:predicted lipoprotein
MLTIGLLATAPAIAGAMPDMAAMQRAMEEAQRCMQSVDQDAVEQMAEEAEAFEAEMRRLCAAGSRDEAQRRALEFSRRIMDDAELQKVRECTAMMREAMEGMPMMRMPEAAEVPTPEEIEATHVCDSL